MFGTTIITPAKTIGMNDTNSDATIWLIASKADEENSEMFGGLDLSLFLSVITGLLSVKRGKHFL